MLKDTLSSIESEMLQLVMEREPLESKSFAAQSSGITSLLNKKLIKRDKEGSYIVNWDNILKTADE